MEKSYLLKDWSVNFIKIFSFLWKFAFESVEFITSIEFGVQGTWKWLHFCKVNVNVQTTNLVCIAPWKANTHEKSFFHMPNYVLFKGRNTDETTLGKNNDHI